MKVWIVNPFDNLPLEGNRPQRYWLMARAFARAGHDVTLWTSDFSHARKARRQLGANVGTSFVRDGFRTVLVATRPYRGHVSVRRIVSHWTLARNWVKRVLGEPQPDLIIVSSPPLFLCAAVRRYCTAHGIPYIVDVQDAWPETFERVVPRLALWPLRCIAAANYRGADAIGVVAEFYADLVKKCRVVVPVRIFRLAIDLSRRELYPERHSVMTPGVLRLVYVGNMGLSYDLVTLADVVERMDGIELDIAGAGPAEADMRQRAARCTRIRVHGYLGDCALRELLAFADVGVIPMFPESCVGIPGKLADYAAAGLPVLNSLTGETERLIADAHAGFSYRAGDEKSLIQAIDRVRSTSFAELRAGAVALAKKFDATMVYDEYERWTMTVVGNSRKG